MPAPTTTTRGPDVLGPIIAPLIAASPLQAGALTTVARDLALAVEWAELRPLQLPGLSWVSLVGRKRLSVSCLCVENNIGSVKLTPQDPLRAVLPLPIRTTALTPAELSAIFRALSLVDIESLPPAMPPLAPSLEALRELKAERAAERARAKGDKEGDKEEPSSAVTEEADADAGPEAALDEFDPDTLYMAITAPDSTVVYYKLSRDIRKPHDIPDE
jgi:hypothetical protein